MPILIPQLMAFTGIRLLPVLNTMLVMVELIMESMRITQSLMNMGC
jgi:predicted nuclease with RNAse H fold